MKWLALRTYQTEIEADDYSAALEVCQDLPLSEFEVRECHAQPLHDGC